MLVSQHLLEGLDQIPEHMEAVGNLAGLGSAPAGPFRTARAAIPTDHLNARMPLQPGGQRIGLAIRQQVEHVPPFEIHQDGPIPAPAPKAPIVDAHHAGCRRSGHGRAAHLPQQRVSTRYHPKGLQQAPARCPADREPHGAQPVVQLCRAPCAGRMVRQGREAAR